MTVSRDKLTARIESFSRSRRHVANAALAYRVGSWALLSTLAALIVLGGHLPNAFLNLGLFAAFVIGLSGLAVRYVLHRQRLKSHVAEAFAMEALAGGLNSRLVSALDFAAEPRPDPLRQVAIDRALADLLFDFEAQVSPHGRNRERRRFAVLAVLVVGLALTPWFSVGRVLSNFHECLLTVGDVLFPLRYEMVPAPGRHVFAVGDTVDVRLRFLGRRFPTVRLVETGEETPATQTIAVDGQGWAQHQIHGEVESERRLHFEFGRRLTAETVLVFANPPVLENMQTELVFPTYTRMLPRSLEGVQQRLFALAGTRISLGFTFSKQLAGATLTMDDGEELPLDVTGRFASAMLIHSMTRSASLQVEDIHGLGLGHPLRIDFDVQIDEPPRVTLPRSLKEEMPVLAGGLKLFGFGARMADDYGVSRCVLKWTRSTVENPARITDRGEIERLISPPRRKVVESFQKVFESVPAQPGDRVNFRVEVYDNRSPQSQMAASRWKSLFVYQEELEGLDIAALHFGRHAGLRERVPKSKRATGVRHPTAMRTQEKVWNTYDADLAVATRAPVIPGSYAQAVKNYFRLISTAVENDADDTEQTP